MVHACVVCVCVVYMCLTSSRLTSGFWLFLVTVVYMASTQTGSNCACHRFRAKTWFIQLVIFCQAVQWGLLACTETPPLVCRHARTNPATRLILLSCQKRKLLFWVQLFLMPTSHPVSRTRHTRFVVDGNRQSSIKVIFWLFHFLLRFPFGVFCPLYACSVSGQLVIVVSFWYHASTLKSFALWYRHIRLVVVPPQSQRVRLSFLLWGCIFCFFVCLWGIIRFSAGLKVFFKAGLREIFRSVFFFFFFLFFFF